MIASQNINRGNEIALTFINSLEAISSYTDKAKIFDSISVWNSTLDDKGHFFLTQHVLVNTISYVHYSLGNHKISQSVDYKKATGPDKNPVLVIMNIHSKLYPTRTKLFNRFINQKSFPCLWKLPSICQILKNAGDPNPHFRDRPISLFSIISKIFNPIINKEFVDHLLSRQAVYIQML